MKLGFLILQKIKRPLRLSSLERDSQVLTLSSRNTSNLKGSELAQPLS